MCSFSQIFVIASITSLSLGDNDLCAEGEAVVRKAVEGRSGFELKAANKWESRCGSPAVFALFRGASLLLTPCRIPTSYGT